MTAGLDWDSASVRVRPIANGFLVTESKTSATGYHTAESAPLFYPTMEGVERELLTRFRAALALDLSTAKEDF